MDKMADIATRYRAYKEEDEKRRRELGKHAEASLRDAGVPLTEELMNIYFEMAAESLDTFVFEWHGGGGSDDDWSDEDDADADVDGWLPVCSISHNSGPGHNQLDTDTIETLLNRRGDGYVYRLIDSGTYYRGVVDYELHRRPP